MRPEVAGSFPELIAAIQLRQGRQILVATHSGDVLRDIAIALEEIVFFRANERGTAISRAVDDQQTRILVEGRVPLEDVVLSATGYGQAYLMMLVGLHR